MADIAISPEVLQANIASALGEQAQRVDVALGEVTVTVSPDHYHAAMKTLHLAFGGEGVDVFAHGLRGDGKMLGQIFDSGVSA